MTTATYLTVGEAARELGVLEAQLRSVLARNPDLPRVRVGRMQAVAPDDLPAIRAALLRAGVLTAALEG